MLTARRLRQSGSPSLVQPAVFANLSNRALTGSDATRWRACVWVTVLSASAASASAEAVSRYATTLFEMARESGLADRVEADARSLAAAFGTSPELGAALASPLTKAEEKVAVVSALAARMKLQDLTTRFLGVVAANGRSGSIGAMARAVVDLAVKARGAVVAEVSTAEALSAAQTADLKAALERAFNAPVDIEPSVKPELIGGLVVKVGSRLFDDSVKTKLETLKTALKGA
jgi:F-type H+-transporting ATPase subunit delta